MKRIILIPKNKSKLLRKRSIHRFKIFFKYHLKRLHKEPVFIIASRRSGSNLFLSYLNSIPGVSFASEILNPDMLYGLRQKAISKQVALNHIRYSINNCEHKICGAKILELDMQTRNIEISDLQRLFPQAKFIVLYRRSILEQYVSLQIAQKTQHWTWTQDFNLPPSLYINPEEFLQFCSSIKSFYKKISEDLANIPEAIFVSYEELRSNPQKLFDEKVFGFLGVTKFPISSEMIKQNTRQLNEMVENFDDIKSFLNQSIVFER